MLPKGSAWLCWLSWPFVVWRWIENAWCYNENIRYVAFFCPCIPDSTLRRAWKQCCREHGILGQYICTYIWTYKLILTLGWQSRICNTGQHIQGVCICSCWCSYWRTRPLLVLRNQILLKLRRYEVRCFLSVFLSRICSCSDIIIHVQHLRDSLHVWKLCCRVLPLLCTPPLVTACTIIMQVGDLRVPLVIIFASVWISSLWFKCWTGIGDFPQCYVATKATCKCFWVTMHNLYAVSMSQPFISCRRLRYKMSIS